MNQQEQSRRFRKTNTFCCYNIDFNDEEEPEQRKNFLDRMPMLGREISSNIHFRNVEHNNRQPIYQLLNDLYEHSNLVNSTYSLLSKKRINPIIHGSHERDDLQYYIPQIITYMVLEKNLQDQELTSLVLKGCSTDFYFAHRVYFYLKSLSVDHNGQIIPSILQFLDDRFVDQMSMYKHFRLSGIEFTKSMIQMDSQMKVKKLFSNVSEDSQQSLNDPLAEEKGRDELMWENYGTQNYPFPCPINPKTVPKVVKRKYCAHGFMETPQLWDDLLEIGVQICLKPIEQRNKKLADCLMEINQNLPANVYIPFFKQEIRLYTILCIWKGRLFSTNTRAPYSIWVEIYRQQQELSLDRVLQVQEQQDMVQSLPKPNKKNLFQKIYQTISKPFSISSQKNTLNLKKFISSKFSSSQEEDKKSNKSKSNSRSGVSVTRSFAEELTSRRYSISEVYEERDKECKSDGRRSMDRQSLSSSISEAPDEEDEQDVEERMAEFFGPKSSDYIQEMKEKSIYRDLKSWRLVHLMVKTGDDIKQQQFAMQLIHRFQYAFEKEKVDCIVFPYQVISLGPDCGIIEMLNDITTLNSLFEKLYKKSMTLKQFFQRVFPDPAKARRNFMRSLAGYLILTYFLQVKDRHNGNILLSREGYIIHIDFGFFLSSAPGRGVELEKKCPFKLLTEYVQVIGQLNSGEFFEFRQLFYKGFRAVLKEKEAILTLVKMMYSSHMESMSCFIRGETAIEQLQSRFSIEQGVESFCYNLINSNLDNWRARWYDKFQYFLQKIYY